MSKQKSFLLIITAALVLVLGSCIVGSTSGTVTSNDIANFQKIFMSSYFAERGGQPGGAKALTPFLQVSWRSGARATIPVNKLTDNSFTNLTPKSLVNYPEPGQTTSFTIVMRDVANNVYDITATTTYPAGDARSNYVEEYYIKDITPGNWSTPDTVWTVDDPVVKLDAGTWVQDQKSRVAQVLTFADGTVRNETIVSSTNNWGSAPTNLPKFASFDVSGSLDFGQFFYPTTDTGAQFSSVVVYSVTPSTNPDFWFWQGSQGQNVLGIRYYTEFKDTGAGKFYAYTILFEKTISTLSTQAVATPQTWQTVFVGSQFDTLAESVLRQQVTYDLVGGDPDLNTGVRVTNMQSRVVNITGQKDFFLQELNSDYATLSGWDTTTVYTPSGDAAEILAGDPSKFLYGRTATEPSGGQPLAVASTSGLGDLASLYTAIQEGALAQNTGTTIPGAIPSTTQDLSFNGNQGSTQPYQASFDLSTKGTVEAWVYIKQQTDTGGIVHKGVDPTFSDECYSLQFWGNQGQVALVLDPTTATGSGGYDLLTSTINLNKNKWYYLVGTWDTTAATPYMRLYINGALNASKNPAECVAHGGVRTNSSDLLIGSQLPVLYNVTYGYFGLNGAINGVRISSTATAAADILTFYNTYKGDTKDWPHP
jgi:hypothetical protein